MGEYSIFAELLVRSDGSTRDDRNVLGIPDAVIDELPVNGHKALPSLFYRTK